MTSFSVCKSTDERIDQKGILYGFKNVIIGIYYSHEYFDPKNLSHLLPLGLEFYGFYFGDNIPKYCSLLRYNFDHIFGRDDSGLLKAISGVDGTNVGLHISEDLLEHQILRIFPTIICQGLDLGSKIDDIGSLLLPACNNISILLKSGLTVKLGDGNSTEELPCTQDVLDGWLPDIFSTEGNNNNNDKADRVKNSKKSKKSTSKFSSGGPSKLPKTPTLANDQGWGSVISIDSLSTAATVVSPNAKTGSSSSFTLRFDILCYCDKSTPFGNVCELFLQGLLTQTIAAVELLGKFSDMTAVREVRAYHFCPKPLIVPVTMLLTSSTPADEAQATRRQLHEALGLPMNRPLLLPQCAARFAANSPRGGDCDSDQPFRLVSPHIGLPGSGLRGGEQYLLDGPYTYYHYLQDKFDDKGWGCAYRSLQTQVSWFKLNHYYDGPIPSHADIQTTLAKMDDKPTNLIGSKEWIGSFEVGYYLDQVLNVSFRIIRVSCGGELAEKARELAVHFETEGTPITMGGGVVAFTMLGIDWNSETGEVRFLILDPHYVGPDDLQQVQQKVVPMFGYKATACGWRPVDFFEKDAFYNLCLPSRPTNIL